MKKSIFLEIFARKQTFDCNFPLLEILLSPFKWIFRARLAFIWLILASIWLHPIIRLPIPYGVIVPVYIEFTASTFQDVVGQRFSALKYGLNVFTGRTRYRNINSTVLLLSFDVFCDGYIAVFRTL